MKANSQSSSSEKRTITISENAKVNQIIIDGLEDLFDFIPPQKLSRKLRLIFLSYMHYESEMLPSDISDTIMELKLLMEFLDESSDQAK